jgi:pimeloyl-ACP methyl ester carboxylesterase
MSSPGGGAATGLPDAPRPAISEAERSMVEIAAGLRLHVSELGTGEPVLMLHGWPQHGGCWHAVAPVLAARYRVICPDLRGFGASDAPGRGYDPDTFAADALALLDALGIERVRLVGHDWGGYASFLVALRQPDRVSALLACSTPLPWVKLTPRLAMEAWRSWYAVVMATVGGQLLSRRPSAFADFITGPGISKEDAWNYTRQLARPPSARATELLYRSYLRTLADFALGRSEPHGRLTVPTRLLLGQRDPAVAEALVTGDHSSHADDLEVEILEGAHHFLPEERPGLVSERALTLFEGVRPAG